MRTKKAWANCVIVAMALGVSACGSSGKSPGTADETGGSTGVGGSDGSDTGGTTASGGSTTSDTGGTTASGGSDGSDTGGTTASGGSDGSDTGGTTATGGQTSVIGPAVTSVPGSTVLSTLTAEQATAICEEAAGNLEPAMVPAMCTAEGAMAAALVGSADAQATCQTAYDACVADAAGSTDCTDAADSTADCDATVDEVNQCYADFAATMQQIGTGCDQMATALVAMMAFQNPASCEALSTACPGLVPSATE